MIGLTCWNIFGIYYAIKFKKFRTWLLLSTIMYVSSILGYAISPFGQVAFVGSVWDILWNILIVIGFIVFTSSSLILWGVIMGEIIKWNRNYNLKLNSNY